MMVAGDGVLSVMAGGGACSVFHGRCRYAVADGLGAGLHVGLVPESEVDKAL